MLGIMFLILDPFMFDRYVQFIFALYVQSLSSHWPFPILKFILVARRQRRRSRSLVVQKKSRKLLPYIPTEDLDRRSKQMESLASALINLKMEFSNDLTYLRGMAPKSANQSRFESDGMQV